MSGKLGVGTVVKVKSQIGQQFLEIIGKSSPSMEGKKEKKASKERLGKALDALEPWYNKGNLIKSGKVKTIGVLGWLEDEHELFASGMETLEAARKVDDYKRAADLAEKAKAYAESLDKSKEDRVKAQAAIKGVRDVLGKITPSEDKERTGKVKDISTRLGREDEALRRGDSPGSILLRVGDLKTEADKLLSGGAPQLSSLQKERYTMQAALNQATNAAEEKVTKLVTTTFSGDQNVALANQATSLFRSQLSPIRMAVSPTKEENDLADDDARLVFLKKNYNQALRDLPGIVDKFSKEIAKNGGADFKKTMQTEVGKENASRALDQDRKTFLQNYVEVETALADLADMLAPAPPALATAVAAAKKKILDGNQFDKGAQVIKTMLQHIATARQDATKTAQTGASTLSNDLSTLRTEISKQAKSAHKRTRPGFEELKTELDQLEVIVKTNNVAAFGSANERVAAIRAAGVTAVPSITQFNAMLDAIEEISSDKVVIKEFQSENNDLLLAVKTVVDGLSLFKLAEAQKTVTGLKRDADKLKGKTDKLGPWRVDMKDRLKTLAAMIKEFHKLVPGTENTTFELNYKQALEQYEKAGVDCPAVTKLVTEATALVYQITNNLMQGGTGQARTINALEADRKLGQAKIDEEEEKKRVTKDNHDTLKGKLDQYAFDIKRATEAVNKAPNGDKEELKELTTLGEQALKKFKSGDEKGAESQWKSIRKRLDALLKTPGGVTAESVDLLAGADRLWENAMKETRDLLDKIVSEATPAAEASRVAPDAVKKHIDGLFNRLQPYRPTLVRSLKVVADPTSELKLRKSEREYALRDVRAMRGIIDGDAVAAKLGANPFGVAAPFGKLRRFLNDMEYNALRAVPPE